MLAADDFGVAVREWFPMAIHLLEGLFLGMRNSQQIIGQRQQLLALGSLSAGLTHELNNPAAAAVRANAALKERVAGMRHKLAMLAHDEIDPRLLELLVDRAGRGRAGDRDRTRPGRRWRSPRREDEITDWLDEHGVTDGWNIAPVFVAAGYDQRASWTSWPQQLRPRCSTGPCAGSPTPWTPSCCWPRSPTR